MGTTTPERQAADRALLELADQEGVAGPGQELLSCVRG